MNAWNLSVLGRIQKLRRGAALSLEDEEDKQTVLGSEGTDTDESCYEEKSIYGDEVFDEYIFNYVLI